MATTVIHKRNSTGAADELYIGRGSPWGNDWSHLNYGKAVHREMISAAEAVMSYADWLSCSDSPHAIDLRDRITAGELVDKKLICYCVDDAGEGVCHGKVLALWTNHYLDDFPSYIEALRADAPGKGIWRCGCELHFPTT